MNSEQSGNINPSMSEEQAEQRSPTSLITKDICGFLRDLARVLDNPVTGNPPLAVALTKLAKALGRYSSQDVDEVLSRLTFKAYRRETRKHGPASQLRGIDVASLDLKTVEEMLRNQLLTKGDIIRVGSERFGISKSKLEHQNREDAIEGIETALRNAEALDIISQEARMEGNRRIS